MLMSIECETTNHCGRRRRQRRRQRRRWKINRVQTKKPFQKLETRQVPQKTDSGVRLDRWEAQKTIISLIRGGVATTPEHRV